ncbi:phage tail protein [Hansschlegelia sp.]|uniref:phage tail protein n=1 Tax=Hansschlegelia sp. TaxID=2041892 RepID=UPI002D17007C|nr:phage tail protein [Hansschlegelia sp.]HVI28108.1 phage tail protein [Hansschlegelia sp.]
MALPTFNPPVPPSAGLSNEPKINLFANEFGDGYTQRSPKGLNHIRDMPELKFELLTSVQAAGVVAFLRERGGYKPFLYTLPDETTAKRWTCAKWKHTRDEAGRNTITATLEQDFSIAS